MKRRKGGSFAFALALLSSMGGALAAQPGPANAQDNGGAAAAAQTPPPAPAAGPVPAAAADQATHLETVVVTGTNLPTSPDAVAVPVVTLDADQLQQNGVTSNPLEVLRKAVPAFAGRSNAGSSNANNNNQNTGGGSQLQLRNLPTLVLINGRRAALSAIGGVNGKNFVDVNQIPAAAIDHVDVLTDGASSIYGSDAIGGVVNFVLKTNYQGVEAGGRIAGAAHYGERSAYLLGGKGWSGGQFTAAASFSQNDPLFQDQRNFSNPIYGQSSAVPGEVAASAANGTPTVVLAPGLYSPSQTNPTGTAATASSINQLIANGTYVATTPGAISGSFNVSPYEQLLLKQEQDSFYASGSQQLLGKSMEFFGDLLFSRDTSSDKFLPISTSVTELANAPYNPTTGNVPGVVFTDLNQPHQFFNAQLALRVTAGLRGDLGHGWTWETGLVYSQSDLQQHQTNLIYKPNLGLAIAGGYDAQGNAVTGGGYSKVFGNFSNTGTPSVLQLALDPFATSNGHNAASLANVYGTEDIRATSRLTSFDFKVVGPLFRLPAGKVVAAFGEGLRREELSGQTDPNGRVTDPVTHSTTGNDQEWIGGTFADPFSKGRDIADVFTEARIPVTSEKWNVSGLHAFDVTVAVRAEHYSDAGYSTVPKLGLRWEPYDKQFSLRGTFARSFYAPSLYSEYGPTDERQVGAAVIQGVFGPAYSGMPFNGEDGNNPQLKPAKSTSRTIGFTFKPKAVPGLSVALDYSDIALSGFQGGIGFNNILASVNNLGSASPFFNNLSVSAYPGAAGASDPFVNPGDLKAYLTNKTTGKGDPNQANNLYAEDQFRNLGSLIERSFALSAEYEIVTDHYGNYTITSTGANFRSFQFVALPGQPSQEFAGFATNNGVFGGTLPKYRFFNSLDWAYNNWDVTLGNTFATGVKDTGTNGTSPPVKVDSYLTFDLRTAYDWRFTNGGYLKDVTFALGVNNIFNRMPPPSPQAFAATGADVSTYSPIGRLLYATAVMKF